MPKSIVIVRRAHGWVAHMRYANRSLDKDVASRTRFLLDRRIDELCRAYMKGTW